MRITVMGIGSRGDVQPLVALAVGLAHRGHQVRFVAGDEFGQMITAAGLQFIPLGVNIQAAMEGHTSIFRFAQSMTDRLLAACAGDKDAIVATFLGVCMCEVARSQHIPFFYAVPMPALSTRSFPYPLFPPLPLGPAYNLLTYSLSDAVAKRSYSYARSLFEEPRPTYLFCFSPAVVPRPPDWGSYAHVTGYWFLDHAPDWQPPAALVRFLDEGQPPVCVGFGSMTGADPQQMTALVLDALARSKQRGILVTGWGGLRQADAPPGVFVTPSVPFDWLFPRMAAAVHHGGAGTAAAALRAGIPSVIVPFGIDQPFWARRVHQLGAAPAPIPLKRLTVARLASAIQTALADGRMRACAATLGETIRSEDGVGNAIGVIEQVAGAGP